MAKKEAFSITQEQCDSIKLSNEPITVLSLMKNINSVIDTASTENKLYEDQQVAFGQRVAYRFKGADDGSKKHL